MSGHYRWLLRCIAACDVISVSIRSAFQKKARGIASAMIITATAPIMAITKIPFYGSFMVNGIGLFQTAPTPPELLSSIEDNNKEGAGAGNSNKHKA